MCYSHYLFIYAYVLYKMIYLFYVNVEVLAEPATAIKLADTKAAGEVKALDAFYQMLQNEPDRAFFG